MQWINGTEYRMQFPSIYYMFALLLTIVLKKIVDLIWLQYSENCLVICLLHGQLNITTKDHWHQFFICLTNVDGYYTTLVLKSLVEIRSQEIFKRMYVSAAFFVWWLLEIVIIMVQEFCHQTYDVLTKANVILKNFFP